MANKNVFKTGTAAKVKKVDATNDAGGKAYSVTDEHALAQYAVTGTFNDSFYTDANTQLERVVKLTENVDPTFIAKCAIYARKSGFMKDMPAFLCAVLAAKGETVLLKSIFDTVIDNGKMLKNFVQIIRSGVTGRKSLGTASKNLVKNWINNRSDEKLFGDSVGNDPSLADVIKMVHPKPANKSREAFYSYLIGKDNYSKSSLPKIVKEFEKYKKDKSGDIAGIPFQLLTSLDLKSEDWSNIAANANWHMTRMNLNTFNRHGVFDDSKMVTTIADRLKDADTIRKVKVFPYQLLTAFQNTADVPTKISNALQDAMEVATHNIPDFGDKKVYVMVDTSGSMGSYVMGSGQHAGYSNGNGRGTTCVDVASLIASCIMRKNDDVEVIPFDTQVHSAQSLNPRDTVMTNSQKLAKFGGGGTDCGAPLVSLNKRNAKGDVVIYLSDNESWFDGGRWSSRYGTSVATEWADFKKRNKGAKCVCVNLNVGSTVQVTDDKDVMNIGGYSDTYWDIIAQFVKGGYTAQTWVDNIKAVEI
jgi:60 kDa SS-A/Ro ribonucleoprotein